MLSIELAGSYFRVDHYGPGCNLLGSNPGSLQSMHQEQLSQTLTL